MLHGHVQLSIMHPTGFVSLLAGRIVAIRSRVLKSLQYQGVTRDLRLCIN